MSERRIGDRNPRGGRRLRGARLKGRRGGGRGETKLDSEDDGIDEIGNGTTSWNNEVARLAQSVEHLAFNREEMKKGYDAMER